MTEAHCSCQKVAWDVTQLPPSIGAISGILREATNGCQLWCQTHETPAAIQSSMWRTCGTCEITLDACVLATESEPLLLRALVVLLQHLRREVLSCCYRMNAETCDGGQQNDIGGTKRVHKKCV